jgi:parallel beta-helix repeat protein
MRGRDASIIVVAIVLASVFAVTITILPGNVKASTLFVGGVGPGNYTTVQGAVDAAKDGDTIFVYNGTYNEEVEINKTLTLVGESQSNTIIASYTVLSVTADWVNITGFGIVPVGMDPDIPLGIRIWSASHCSIHNNTLEPSTMAGVGIRMSSSSDNTISNNRFINSSSGIGVWTSHNNAIHNNTLINMISGINLYRSDNNTLANNTVQLSWLALEIDGSVNNTAVGNVMTEGGIHMDGDLLEHWSTHTIDDTNVVNGKPIYYLKNVVGGTVAAGGGQVILGNATGVVVEDQDVSNVYSGIQVGFSSHNYVANNTAKYAKTDGITLLNSENNTVHNNDLSFNRRGLSLYTSNTNTVSFNTLTSNTGHGITVDGHFNTIANNTLSGNWYGISLTRNEQNIVVNNTAFGNDVGIHLTQSHINIVSGNNASGNAICGIRIGQSDGNTVDNNTLYMNSLDGFIISNSGNNTIDSNVVSFNNRNGVWIYASFNNMFFHNSLIENTLQAIDSNGTNAWDNGYPSGGNFWSDYAGSDLKSGPNQDQPGSDGIGDVPYVIDPDSRDRYPLIDPYVVGPARPPSISQVDLSGTGFADVTITWSLSPDDGMGYDNAVSYEIYRGMTFDPDGVGYVLSASVPNGTSQYVDPLAGEGDPNNYFYRVCVTDTDGGTSCSSVQGGKFTRSLSVGMNLVSIPLVQSDERIRTVFQTIEWNSACGYNESFSLWLCYDDPKGVKELFTIPHTHGYWINVTQDSNITVAGIVPGFTKVPLRNGWNLVGYPSFNTTYTVGDMKADTGAVRVEGFDPTSPPYYLRKLDDWEFLETGFGYWIDVATDTSWHIRNP